MHPRTNFAIFSMSFLLVDISCWAVKLCFKPLPRGASPVVMHDGAHFRVTFDTLWFASFAYCLCLEKNQIAFAITHANSSQTAQNLIATCLCGSMLSRNLDKVCLCMYGKVWVLSFKGTAVEIRFYLRELPDFRFRMEIASFSNGLIDRSFFPVLNGTRASFQR